eukprot:m.72340 g.72340  ORF g.72340 m.72340 type:complete len:62 (-) comp16099_c0_seq40:630-815(-)
MTAVNSSGLEDPTASSVAPCASSEIPSAYSGTCGLRIKYSMEDLAESVLSSYQKQHEPKMQ